MVLDIVRFYIYIHICLYIYMIVPNSWCAIKYKCQEVPQPLGKLSTTGKAKYQSTTGKAKYQSTTGKAKYQSTTGKPKYQSTTGKAKYQSTTGKTKYQSTTGKPKHHWESKVPKHHWESKVPQGKQHRPVWGILCHDYFIKNCSIYICIAIWMMKNCPFPYILTMQFPINMCTYFYIRYSFTW